MCVGPDRAAGDAVLFIFIESTHFVFTTTIYIVVCIYMSHCRVLTAYALRFVALCCAAFCVQGATRQSVGLRRSTISTLCIAADPENVPQNPNLVWDTSKYTPNTHQTHNIHSACNTGHTHNSRRRRPNTTNIHMPRHTKAVWRYKFQHERETRGGTSAVLECVKRGECEIHIYYICICI